MPIELKKIKELKTKQPEKSAWLSKDFLTKDIKFFKKRFGDKKKESFYTKLSMLVSMGIQSKEAIPWSLSLRSIAVAVKRAK